MESTKTERNNNTIKAPTEDGQACEHNKMFEDQCGNKHETITVASDLFINLVIHCHRLALRIFMSSRQVSYKSVIPLHTRMSCLYPLLRSPEQKSNDPLSRRTHRLAVPGMWCDWAVVLSFWASKTDSTPRQLMYRRPLGHYVRQTKIGRPLICFSKLSFQLSN